MSYDQSLDRQYDDLEEGDSLKTVFAEELFELRQEGYDIL